METKYDKKINKPENYISATPSPSPEELREFYSELYYQTPQSSSYQDTYDDLEINYKRLKCDSLLHAIKQAGIVSGNFLDIGAGEGFLMDAAHKHGFEVTGLDFSSYGVGKFFPELLTQHIAGDVYESLAKFGSEGKRYVACAATNVLEHVIDPELFLTSIRQVMDTKGVLAITVPNDFSELHQLLLKHGLINREFWFVPPHHLHYFNTENLPQFLVNSGFEVIDAFSDFPVDLYLLHAGSNYVMDAKNGRAAHQARMHHDLMIAKAGLDKYLNYYRAMFNVGVGRDITILVRPKSD